MDTPVFMEKNGVWEGKHRPSVQIGKSADSPAELLAVSVYPHLSTLSASRLFHCNRSRHAINLSGEEVTSGEESVM